MMGRIKDWFASASAHDAAPADSPPTAPQITDDVTPAFGEGLAYFQNGELKLAASAFTRALEQLNNPAEAHFYLGLIHKKRGELEDAADCFLLATSFNVKFFDAWFYLGVVDLARGRLVKARQCLDTALHLDSKHAGAHAAYAKLCESEKQWAAAIGHWQAVAAVKPDDALACCNLGRLTLRESLDDKRALDYVQQALALQPQLAEAHSCHAQILQFQGRCREAIEACDIALHLDPTALHTQMIRALALLSAGEFESGWRDYEARKQVYPVYAMRKMPYPEWDGSPLAGKRLLIYHEQGIGDEIMFASCFPDVLRAGADCVIECSARLEEIFARSFPAAKIVVADQTSPSLAHLNALPPCDYQVAAGSLPRFLRRTAGEFPDRGAYLLADAGAHARWRNRLSTLGSGLNVGLSWRGGVQHTNQASRSIPLDVLSPLLAKDNCNFVSLQYGAHGDEIATVKSQNGREIFYWPESLATYDETAALVSSLDLIISVDTAVAHLAAALGKPTWVLVPPNAEWRYMTQGSSMLWYPSMRVFRRRLESAWKATVEEVAGELERWPRSRPAGA